MRSYSIIVGRFQVALLHPGHIDTLVKATQKQDELIVFLGVSPIKTTIYNPLNFEMRKHLFQCQCPSARVYPLKDYPSDIDWSKNLDAAIDCTTNGSTNVILYGGRDSFIPYYSGKHKCIVLPSTPHSGTEERERIGNNIIGSDYFRSGVIWATQNQYINATPCVDIAPIFGDSVLLGKRNSQPKKILWRTC